MLLIFYVKIFPHHVFATVCVHFIYVSIVCLLVILDYGEDATDQHDIYQLLSL